MYNTKKLAQNIRKFRKRSGLTQAALAERLYVSPQNISKWELSLSVPDIEKLCLMASIFKISTDTLLGFSASNAENALIAIDGGGTKTEFLLFLSDGTILSRLVLERSNPNSCGMPKALDVLKRGIDLMLEKNMNVFAVYAGIAGSLSGKNKKHILDFLKQSYPSLRFYVNSDILNVIQSTLCDDDCIAAICGTGSVVYAKTAENFQRIGGWGYLFEDGSGYAIGRDVFRAALKQNDGITPKTALLSLCENRLGNGIWESLDKIYSSGKDFIASFATVAFEAFEAGDEAAREIIAKNAKSLAFYINNAQKQLPSIKKLILSGSVIQKNKVFLDLLLENISPRLSPLVADVPQILGAALCCCKLFLKPDENFFEKLKENYQKEIEE